MHNGSIVLLGALAAALLALGAIESRAQDEIPLEFGTYSRQKDWCKTNRADPKGPGYTERRAFINLSASEINWDQTVGKITNVSVNGNKINLDVTLTTPGRTETKTLPLVRKDKKLFVLSGINFFYCSDYQPNPWLGH